MKKLLSLSAGLVALSLAGTASAIPVDFRSASFAAGHGLNHFENSAATYDFTFDTLRASDMRHEGTLFWDVLDGYGIRNTNNWDADEIEGSEILKISFGEEIHLDSFTVADLFIEGNHVEVGLYSLDGGANWTHFYANSAVGNGEVTVTVEADAHDILFRSAGSTGYRVGHEFSVIAMDLGREYYDYDQGNGPAVPEPSAALLFAAGALFVRGRSRRA
jgi:hypothetical protein